MRKLLIMLMTATFTIGAAGALAACGSDSTSPEQAAREALDDVDIDDDSVTYEDDDSSVTIGACSDLPEGFPTDAIPLPDEDPQSCTRTVSDGEAYFAITWDGDVYDDVKSGLTSGDFTLDSEGETDSGTSKSKYATLTSPEWQVSLSLNIYEDDDFGGTTTSISVYSNSSSDF